MRRIKTNAKKSDMSDFTKLFVSGLEMSFKKLLQQRCRENGSFYFSNDQGQPVAVSAKEVRTNMLKKISNNRY